MALRAAILAGMKTVFPCIVTRALAALAFLLVLPAAVLAQPSTTQGTLVRVATPYGPIDIALNDRDAPRTVANFLQYVNQGLYDGSFFHRLVRGFVIQGGGLRVSETGTLSQVPTSTAIANEFSRSRSNLRGTVAMAKVASNPDSATSQWFINLADNSANLDNQNGGFTVFGRVLAPGMVVADSIGRLNIANAAGCTNLGNFAGWLGELPVTSAVNSCPDLKVNSLIRSGTVRVLAPRTSASVAERVFEFLEATYPSYVAPASPSTLQSGALTYRYYASTNSYLAVSGDRVHALVPAVNSAVVDIGPLETWLQQAASADY